MLDEVVVSAREGAGESKNSARRENRKKRDEPSSNSQNLTLVALPHALEENSSLEESMAHRGSEDDPSSDSKLLSEYRHLSDLLDCLL